MNDPSLPPRHSSGDPPEIQPDKASVASPQTPRSTGRTGDWTPPTPEKLSQLLVDYRVERLIGRGGMGAVYQGVQLVLERPVAIKILPAELADEEFISRFQREARMLAKLHHPGIVGIHDFGQTSEGHLYFVMEFVDGKNLSEMIRSLAIDPTQALELTVQICEALNYAHSQGIIHRDVKPANILVNKNGRAKLADFGLARPFSDEPGTLMVSLVARGTPDYMAPEQREGRADNRTDIYSLGVLLYEMLTGKRPRGVFDPPSFKVQVDVRLDQVVIKALQQEPERRYQLVREMGTEVDNIRKTPPPQAKAPVVESGVSPKQAEVPIKGESRTWKNSMLAIAGAIVIPLLAVGSFFIWNKKHQAAAASPATNTATKDQSFVNSLGMKFVPVPITGGPTDGKKVLFSIWDTRVKDYEAYAKAKGITPEKPSFEQTGDHPVVNVSWEDAKAFCAWLTQSERAAGRLPAGWEYRLPSDHEWSCAIGIGEKEDAAASPKDKDGKIAGVYPWGNAWPPPKGFGNYDSSLGVDKYANTSPVGSFSADRNGLYDMGGNVWQWCEDLYDKDQKSRVLRGNSWRYLVRDSLLSSYRYYRTLDRRYDDRGFRCVLLPSASTPPPTAAPVQAVSSTIDKASQKMPNSVFGTWTHMMPWIDGKDRTIVLRCTADHDGKPTWDFRQQYWSYRPVFIGQENDGDEIQIRFKMVLYANASDVSPHQLRYVLKFRNGQWSGQLFESWMNAPKLVVLTKLNSSAAAEFEEGKPTLGMPKTTAIPVTTPIPAPIANDADVFTLKENRTVHVVDRNGKPIAASVIPTDLRALLQTRDLGLSENRGLILARAILPKDELDPDYSPFEVFRNGYASARQPDLTSVTDRSVISIRCGYSDDPSHLEVRKLNYKLISIPIPKLDPSGKIIWLGELPLERYARDAKVWHTVSGRVTTESGTPLNIGEATLRVNGTVAKLKCPISDGSFSFADISPGEYLVEFYIDGFAAETGFVNVGDEDVVRNVTAFPRRTLTLGIHNGSEIQRTEVTAGIPYRHASFQLPGGAKVEVSQWAKQIDFVCSNYNLRVPNKTTGGLRIEWRGDFVKGDVLEFLDKNNNQVVWTVDCLDVSSAQQPTPAKPSPASTATVKGRVTDETGHPVVKAHFYLESHTSGGYNASTPQGYTDANGNYSVVVPNPANYGNISMSSPVRGLEDDWKPLTLKEGNTTEINFTLFSSKQVTLDYVFQSDGSRDFAAKSVKKGRIDFRRPNFGFLFADGIAHATSKSDDLRLECRQGAWLFRNFHGNNETQNGFYDAGAVTFENVTTAAENRYSMTERPCVVGHTYVVRTFDGHYAKFVVRSIEPDPSVSAVAPTAKSSPQPSAVSSAKDPKAFTLAAKGILALDDTKAEHFFSPPFTATITARRERPNGGVEMDIHFLSTNGPDNSLYLTSNQWAGAKTLIGLDVSAFQTYALKLTLLAADGSTTASPDMTGGALIGPTEDGHSYGYRPVRIGLPSSPSAISRTDGFGQKPFVLGLTISLFGGKWTDGPHDVTVLVEPVEGATPLPK